MLQSRLQSSLQSDYATKTSSFFSNILTTTTSKYNTLRRQLISSEADGDTEDDSHIARALRAYYTEKGKTFPEWLPPDPKAPVVQQPVTQFVSSSAQGQQIGGLGQQARWGGRGGGLSDLWGDNGGARPSSGPPGNESLRQRPPIATSNSAGSGRFGQQQKYDSAPAPQETARPLPSQRAGSIQSQGSGRFETASPPPNLGAGGGNTAQERLKARLWGAGRSGSPPQTGGAPPPPQQAPANPYTRNQGSYGDAPSSRSTNPYADQGGSRNANPYANQSGARQGGGGSNPIVSANSPWSGQPDPYAGGGGGGYNDQGRSSGGLPSGPRAGRQGMGLPSGPRPQQRY